MVRAKKLPNMLGLLKVPPISKICIGIFNNVMKLKNAKNSLK